MVLKMDEKLYLSKALARTTTHYVCIVQFDGGVK